MVFTLDISELRNRGAIETRTDVSPSWVEWGLYDKKETFTRPLGLRKFREWFEEAQSVRWWSKPVAPKMWPPDQQPQTQWFRNSEGKAQQSIFPQALQKVLVPAVVGEPLDSSIGSSTVNFPTVNTAGDERYWRKGSINASIILQGPPTITDRTGKLNSLIAVTNHCLPLQNNPQHPYPGNSYGLVRPLSGLKKRPGLCWLDKFMDC